MKNKLNKKKIQKKKKRERFQTFTKFRMACEDVSGGKEKDEIWWKKGRNLKLESEMKY